MLIEKKIRKKSGKPFKSGYKVGTVIDEVVNPHTGKDGYLLKEDGSIVDQDKCEIIEC